MLTRSLVLTDAQIKALPTTPIEIVPAPEIGKLLRFIYGVIALDSTAGAYTNLGTAAGYFAYDTVLVFDQASLLFHESERDFLGRAAKSQCSFPPFTSWSAAQAAQVALNSGGDLTNTNIGFTIDSSGGNFTGGNTANTMKVTAFYEIISI
jgi:hypothetical protein